jgi:ATP-dependent Lon protease
MSTLNVEQLVKAYIKMRDARQQLLREFDEADDRIKQQQDVVQQALLELCKETGTDGLKTSAGTVTRTIKTRYWTSDWNSMKNFIKENDAFELLEQRVHQTNMKSFLEENPNLMPPGMNIDSKYAITVRRK